jgi:Ca2+-binding EF-hand superfamily protein
MEMVDADNSGFIDYSEFVMAAIQKETMLAKNNLDTAFHIFDKDDSGTISA